MTTVQTGTLVGYDAITGEKVFAEVNRPITMVDGTSSLLRPNDVIVSNDKRYFVVGIRRTSTETLYEMDVTEEK